MNVAVPRGEAAKPVILAVDDDLAVLGAIDRDLRQRFRADYRVVKAGTPSDALDAARELAARNVPVAVFLVDQRMPGMSGLELLAEAGRLHPGARMVLLTAYADTDVAIAGINEIPTWPMTKPCSVAARTCPWAEFGNSTAGGTPNSRPAAAWAPAREEFAEPLPAC